MNPSSLISRALDPALSTILLNLLPSHRCVRSTTTIFLPFFSTRAGRASPSARFPPPRHHDPPPTPTSLLGRSSSLLFPDWISTSVPYRPPPLRSPPLPVIGTSISASSYLLSPTRTISEQHQAAAPRPRRLLPNPRLLSPDLTRTLLEPPISKQRPPPPDHTLPLPCLNPPRAVVTWPTFYLQPPSSPNSDSEWPP